MENGEKVWFSQNLFWYKDNQYQTNSTLELSTSCNTSDFRYFTSATFNISITDINNVKRAVYINHADSVELENSIESIIKSEPFNGTEVSSLEKKFRDKVLKCGFKKTVDEEMLNDFSPPNCPKCNTSTPMAIKEKIDLVDELSDLAEKTSAKVELISKNSEEGDSLYSAFSGLAGILRYAVDL